MAVVKRARRRAAPIFAALGDETRLRLLDRLCAAGPLSISALAAASPVTRQAITKHLRRMHAAGLLRVTRQGRERVWEVEPDALDEAQRYLNAIADHWDAALARLQRFVER